MLKSENNPWLGLASYEYEDSNRFFGREKELSELKESICNNHFTTIYGISGAGKTSFVNAGMIPLLEKDNYLPVRIRLEHNSSIHYNTQIIKGITDAILKINGEVESFSVVNIDEIDIEDQLWYFLFTSKFWTSANRQITPVIFIDQFEEIFTQNEDNVRVENFFETINALQYNIPPVKIGTLLSDYDSYIEFNDIAKFRIVFVMREDFLARLEDYSYNIPSLRHNRRGINRMNGLQALDVILKPNSEIVTRDVALQILSKVSGRQVKDNETALSKLSIDTSILSLFCSELYQHAVKKGEGVLTESLVAQLGDDIISSFYDKSMTLVSEKSRRYLEEHLLTFSGFRNSVAVEDLIHNGVSEEELKKLAEKRLIRIESFENVPRAEFTHDVLCKVAKTKIIERQVQVKAEF